MTRSKLFKVCEYTLKMLPILLVVIWALSAGLAQSTEIGGFDVTMLDNIVDNLPTTQLGGAINTLFGMLGNNNYYTDIVSHVLGWWLSVDVALLAYEFVGFLIKTLRNVFNKGAN